VTPGNLRVSAASCSRSPLHARPAFAVLLSLSLRQLSMGKKTKQSKRQTRISLAPVERPALQPNLALDENSRAASVRFDTTARTPKPRAAKSTSQRTRHGKTPQGTLELAFARGESREAAQLYSFGLPTPLKSSQPPDPHAGAMSGKLEILCPQ
jgi:hypothetical protein